MAAEATIQSKIIDYINSLIYGCAENVSGSAAQSGRADINACVYGRTLKIEVKTEDTRYGREGATTKQRLYLERWARAGAFSCVVYNLDDVKYCVGMMFGKQSIGTSPKDLQLSGRGKWYDVQDKRWVDISH
jgi:hypothetical protein